MDARLHRPALFGLVGVALLALEISTPAGPLKGRGLSRTQSATIAGELPVAGRIVGAKRKSTRQAGTSEARTAAITAAAAGVTLTQNCLPASVQRGALTECSVEAVNSSLEPRVVDLDSFTNKALAIEGVSGATAINAYHVRATPNVILAGLRPGVPSVAPGASPAGYLPLDIFGVVPTPVGDEEFLNLNVPAFMYAGQTWTTIGVNSNGYIVVGGGSSEDNNCCSLPRGPHPERPNNVLAPFWTDLDGTGAPGIFSAVLTDGVNSWIVIEFRVNVFGTVSRRVFQVWIGINAAQDISFVYNPASLPANPNGQAFLIGAENIQGHGRMSDCALPTVDQRVTSTGFVSGGTLSYMFAARGAKIGTGAVTTMMRIAGLPDLTTAETQVAVTRLP